MIHQILTENDRRNELTFAPFDPISGKDSLGERVKVIIPDFIIPVQYLPLEMMKIPFVQKLISAGSIRQFLFKEFYEANGSLPNIDDPQMEADFSAVSQTFIKLRCRFDFPFWAASFVKIKKKGGGEDVLFRLTYPQRILVEKFEEKRRANLPIRLILLKARQWGGSTTTQLYMAWLQLLHKTGLNSLIIAHLSGVSDIIREMFFRMMNDYPPELLDLNNPKTPKMVGVGKSGSIHSIPSRNCQIKLGTAENPDGCRGGDYNLVHLSEVGLWKKTDGKAPEDIVQSACSGILLKPYTMIVMESTANGTGNFFHSEYKAAADPDIPSQFSALFIAWFQIEQYSIPFKNGQELKKFATDLYNNRLNSVSRSAREESGQYLWWLWKKGASLEAINWYIHERAGKNDHAVMAAEYPSDDIEAFVHSGAMVFDKYKVEDFAPACRPPRLIGEISGKASEGKEALQNLKFIQDAQGALWIWALPDNNPAVKISDRFLTVVDVGGRSNDADWSVIVVFDRVNMIDGDRPEVVAQWRGHCDIDQLSWKAAQIAAFYDNSLLVIESNTLETHDRERILDGGDQSLYILSQIADVYPNLYARRQSEDEIRQRIPRKYGFHTNISTKPMIISTLIKVVREHLYTERDKRCLSEYLDYERKQNGAYGAIAGKHDDILMTRAIGLHICFYEMPIPKILSNSPKPKTYKNRRPLTEASI
ncbi:MAG: terminase [Muribaculaceae bacterium]|nr:terminase [Muribaculaceae bacterium]